MRWSDVNTNSYLVFDENQRAIRGYWLTTIGVDLENLPSFLFQPFEFYPSKRKSDSQYVDKKVYVDDIIGTSYDTYACSTILESFVRIRRGHKHISDGIVTRGKYFRMLKKPVESQPNPILLSQFENESKYWIDGNGNHRVIFYKLMMLAELAHLTSWHERCVYDQIKKKYWLYARVRINTPND